MGGAASTGPGLIGYKEEGRLGETVLPGPLPGVTGYRLKGGSLQEADKPECLNGGTRKPADQEPPLSPFNPYLLYWSATWEGDTRRPSSRVGSGLVSAYRRGVVFGVHPAGRQ